MNILLIGMNTENITTRLWNDTEAICECELKQWTMDKEVINFVKKQTTAVIRCDTGVVKDVEPKDVLSWCKDARCIPCFVADEKNNVLEYMMYLNLKDEFNDKSVCYFKNSDNKDFDDFISILKSILMSNG